jgi:hypothetical protein
MAGPVPAPAAKTAGPDPADAPVPPTTTTTTTVDRERREVGGLSLTQVAGGAVAAAVSAVAASFFGVGGTVGGAALGSVVYTLAATIFSRSVNHAAKVSRTLVIRRAVAPARPDGAAPTSAVPAVAAGEEPAEKVVEYTTRSGKPPRPADSIWNRIRWKPLTLVAGLVFVAAMAVISITELALGHPLGNSKASGTTVGDLGGFSSGRSNTSTPAPTARPTASTVPTPTGTVGVGASPSATPSTGTPTTPPSGTQTSPGLQTTAPGGSATTSSAPSTPQPSASR